MRLILVTGGARSGKSDYAERRAAAIGGDAVTFIATARADDEEMAARIARHRAGRPDAWSTLEAPRDAAAALRAARTDTIVLDCLTLLASNALLASADAGEAAAGAAVAAAVGDLLDAAAARRGTLIVVTNEVGFGIVPPTTLGRWFRDALGTANRRVAEAADEVVLMLSGIPVVLKSAPPGPGEGRRYTV